MRDKKEQPKDNECQHDLIFFLKNKNNLGICSKIATEN